MSEYFVNLAGTNGNALSLAAGKTTWAAALTLAYDGDIVTGNDGVYNEQLTTIRSGVTVRALNQRAAMIKPLSPIYAVGVLSILNNKTRITADGLVFDGTHVQDIGVVSFDGTGPSNNPTYCTIKNCTVQNGTHVPSDPNSASSGIEIGANGHAYKASTFHTFQDCIIFNIGHGGHGHGVYLGSSDNLAKRLQIYNVQGYALQIYNGSPGCDRNTGREILAYQCGSSGNGTGAVIISGGVDHLVFNSIFHHNYDTLHVRYGAIRAGIFNNTFYKNDASGNPDAQIDVSCQLTKIQNNIFYQNGSDGISDSGSESIITPNLIGINPLFVNAVGGDFRLQAGSPAIDAGLDLSAHFFTDYNGYIRG